MEERRNMIDDNFHEPGEIARDIGNEREVIRADFFNSRTSPEVFRREGFPDLENDEILVDDIRHASSVQHITADGDFEDYKARNFKTDKYNPENLLEARGHTDESQQDPTNVINTQLEALRLGGKYRFIYKTPDITTRTGGAFLWFLKEEFPFSLSEYGIYKKSEWEKLKDIEIFNSCLVHCFKDHKYYERVLYSKASIYTLCSKKIFEIIADMIESNIMVHKIKITKNEKKKNDKNYTEVRIYPYYGADNRKYEEDFHICLLQGHYFPFIEDTGFTTKYIRNCIWKDEEKDMKKLITKYKLYKSKTSPLNSFNLIKLMIEMKDNYFEDFNSEILKEPRKEEVDMQIMFKDYEQFDVDFDSRICKKPKDNIPDEFETILEENEELDEEELFNNLLDQEELKIINNKFKEKEIFHGDIETAPNHEGRHIPYLMCIDDNEGTRKRYFWGQDCVWYCLNYLAHIRDPNKNTIFKFQNLGFDITQIRDVLSRVVDSIEPSRSKVYRLKGIFKPNGKKKKFPIIFTDQYPQIPMRLDNYKISFHLEQGKTKGFRHDFYANIKNMGKDNLIASRSCYNELIKVFDKKYIFKNH